MPTDVEDQQLVEAQALLPAFATDYFNESWEPDSGAEEKIRALGYLIKKDNADPWDRSFHLVKQSGSVRIARQMCVLRGITMSQYDRETFAFDKKLEIDRWKQWGWM